MPVAIDDAVRGSAGNRNPQRAAAVAHQSLNGAPRHFRRKRIAYDNAVREVAERRRATEPNASLGIAVRGGEKRRALPTDERAAANLADIGVDAAVAARKPKRSGGAGDERGGRKVILRA